MDLSSAIRTGNAPPCAFVASLCRRSGYGRTGYPLSFSNAARMSAVDCPWIAISLPRS